MPKESCGEGTLGILVFCILPYKMKRIFGSFFFVFCSDFPFVTEECGYSNSWKIVDSSLFSEEELAFVMGGTIQSLFKGAWED